MLESVTELAQDRIGNVERVLGDEKDSDSLGTDETYDLLDFSEKLGRCICEEEVGFVEEEHKLRLVEIACFRQVFEQLAEEPEQERSVELRRQHELVSGEDVDDSTTIRTTLDEVVDVEGRFAEEDVAALLFEHQQLSLNSANGCGGYVTVVTANSFGIIRHPTEHCLEILQVEEE